METNQTPSETVLDTTEISGRDTTEKPGINSASEIAADYVKKIKKELGLDECVMIFRKDTNVAAVYDSHFYDAAKLVKSINTEFINKIGSEIFADPTTSK